MELTRGLTENLVSVRSNLQIHLLATDPSGTMLNLAESRLKDLPHNVSVEFRQVGIYPPPASRLFDTLKGKQFDFLLASYVLFWMENWDDVLDQFLECLSPGGYLCVILLSRDKGKECSEFYRRLYEIAHQGTGFRMEFAEVFEELLRQRLIDFETDFVTCNTDLEMKNTPKVNETLEFIMRFPKSELTEQQVRAIEDHVCLSAETACLECYEKLIWVRREND